MADRTEQEIIAYAYSPEHMNKTAPVQGYPGGIPWPIHLEAYEAYCGKYSKQTALIDLHGRGCRGGFHVSELDKFVPNWRDRVSEMGRLRRENAELRDRVSSLSSGHSTWLGRPEYEPKTEAQEQGYLIEEFGEALAALGKTLRWGLESYNPELPLAERETNRAWLLRELKDAQRAITRLMARLEADHG